MGHEFYEINAQPALTKCWVKVQSELGNAYQSFHLNVHLNMHLNVDGLDGHQNGPQNVHINVLSAQVEVEDKVWSFHYFFGRVGGGWVGVLDEIKAISSFN